MAERRTREVSPKPAGFSRNNLENMVSRNETDFAGVQHVKTACVTAPSRTRTIDLIISGIKATGPGT
jgi:hypothetical protein